MTVPSFIKLTHVDGESIWVNRNMVAWFFDTADNTRVAFAGDENDFIEVRETPEAVLDQLIRPAPGR